jgi:hypothetical protein
MSEIGKHLGYGDHGRDCQQGYWALDHDAFGLRDLHSDEGSHFVTKFVTTGLKVPTCYYENCWETVETICLVVDVESVGCRFDSYRAHQTQYSCGCPRIGYQCL